MITKILVKEVTPGVFFLYHKGYARLPRCLKTKSEHANNLHKAINFDVYINQMIESSIDFDQLRYEKIIHNAFLQHGLRRLVKGALPFYTT